MHSSYFRRIVNHILAEGINPGLAAEGVDMERLEWWLVTQDLAEALCVLHRRRARLDRSPDCTLCSSTDPIHSTLPVHRREKIPLREKKAVPLAKDTQEIEQEAILKLRGRAIAPHETGSSAFKKVLNSAWKGGIWGEIKEIAIYTSFSHLKQEENVFNDHFLPMVDVIADQYHRLLTSSRPQDNGEDRDLPACVVSRLDLVLRHAMKIFCEIEVENEEWRCQVSGDLLNVGPVHHCLVPLHCVMSNELRQHVFEVRGCDTERLGPVSTHEEIRLWILHPDLVSDWVLIVFRRRNRVFEEEEGPIATFVALALHAFLLAWYAVDLLCQPLMVVSWVMQMRCQCVAQSAQAIKGWTVRCLLQMQNIHS